MTIDSKSSVKGNGEVKRRRGAKARQRSLLNKNDVVTEKSSKKSGENKEDEKSKIVKSPSSFSMPSPAGKTPASRVILKGEKNKQTKKKQKTKAPKPGEEGFLTPTQLRNARKRRAKQKKNQQGAPGSKVEPQNSEATISKCSKNETKQIDPSLKYISNPTSAPIVRSAIRFFKELQPPITKFQVHSGSKKHWRTVAKLPVRSRPGNGKVAIGLFKPNSHEIIPIHECLAHHPSVDGAVRAVTEVCNEIGIVPYNETDGKGQLRYIAVNVERHTGKVQLTLVWNSQPYKSKAKHNSDQNQQKEKVYLDNLIQKLIHNGTTDNRKDHFRLHSLWIHFNSQWKHANNIFDYAALNDNTENSGWVLKYGPRYVEETLDLNLSQNYKQPFPVKLFFPPNVFRQANIDAFTKIIASIRKLLVHYIQKDRKVPSLDSVNIKKDALPSCLELYGGVGTIGLNISDIVSSLVSSDENPNNQDSFSKSVTSLSTLSCGILNDKNISYIPVNATDMILKHTTLKNRDLAEILIVDPPRKGLERIVTDSLINFNRDEGPKMIIYVSCGFDAFKNDSRTLLDSGLWNLTHAEGHLLFPGSDAIETLAVFSRNE